jgi:predicted MPP superfamily phosphohydrolase
MGNILAVGDIHTKTWIIDKVAKVIDDFDKVIFCGDYADDFTAKPQDTINTWESLKDLQAKNQSKVELVMGNHDYIYVYNTPTEQAGYNPTTHLLIDTPQNKKLKNWLIGIPIIIEIDGVTYSHAGIANEWSGAEDIASLWGLKSPIWARPDIAGITYKDIPQVFGHTPSKTCYPVKPDVWCIDTFSTYSDGSLYGDGSVLQIIDGKKFNKLFLE